METFCRDSTSSKIVACYKERIKELKEQGDTTLWTQWQELASHFRRSREFHRQYFTGQYICMKSLIKSSE